MRRVVVLALLVAFALHAPASAGAGEGYAGYTQTGPNRGQVEVAAEQGGSGAAGVHRTGSDPWAGCWFQPIDETYTGLHTAPEYLAPAGPDGWWLVMCSPADRLPAGYALWPRGGGLPPAVRDLLVESAVGALEVPYLAPRSSPAGTFDRPLVTGLDTWFWVDAAAWSPVQATASIPVATVTATATPSTLTFEPGDGGPATTCHGPGQVWDNTADPSAASGCGHRYERTSGGSTWPLSVTVEWDVTWSCSPGCGTGDGAPFVLTVTRPVTVHQIQTRISR